MANYRAVANGNWSSGATWGGGAVPPNGEGHNIYSNNFAVTIDQDVDVALITNASVTASFVGGGTSAAAGGGFTVSATGYTISANLETYSGHTSSTLTFSAGMGSTLILNGNVVGNAASSGRRGVINKTDAGTLTVNGNVSNLFPTNGGYNSAGITTSAGFLVVNGNLSTSNANTAASFTNGNNACAVHLTGTAELTVNSGTITGGSGGSANSQAAISQNSSSAVITLNNCIVNAGSVSVAIWVGSGAFYSNNGVLTALNGVAAISSSIVNANGTFVYSSNGTNPVGGARLILGSTPANAYFQCALNGVNSDSFVRYFTADNNLGQANPTDVRSGVSYASGNLTGRLTVPARGSVALSVNYGPSMPFTATRSGTTATATLAYSYPLVAGDQITVTGASNTEWNSTYTIASVVSGTEITFTVPATHSTTAGTGAAMQTTGTAVLDPTAVASAVWSATTREITGGTVDTLTNAPASVTPTDIWSHSSRTLTSASGPSAADIRTELDTNSTKLANLDATVSSRLASASYTAPANSDITAIKSKTDALPSDPADQSLLEAAIAAVTAPSATDVATAVRTELATELARVDAAISTRLASASYTAPANSDISAIKSKTDAINVERINNTATLSHVGNLLAQANS
jgi:hypothetical protein